MIKKVSNIRLCLAVTFVILTLSVIAWLAKATYTFDVRPGCAPIIVFLFLYLALDFIHSAISRNVKRGFCLFVIFILPMVLLSSNHTSRQTDYSKRLQEEFQMRFIARQLGDYYESENSFPPTFGGHKELPQDATSWRLVLSSFSGLTVNELPDIFTSPFDNNGKTMIPVKTRYKTVTYSLEEKHSFFIIIRDNQISPVDTIDDLSFTQFENLTASTTRNAFPGYFNRPLDKSAMLVFSADEIYSLSSKGLLKALSISPNTKDLQKNIKVELESEKWHRYLMSILFIFLNIILYGLLLLLLAIQRLNIKREKMGLSNRHCET